MIKTILISLLKTILSFLVLLLIITPIIYFIGHVGSEWKTVFILSFAFLVLFIPTFLSERKRTKK